MGFFIARVLAPHRRRHYNTTAASEPPPDPFSLPAPELRQSLLSLLDSDHPLLSEMTRYYFLHPSKQIRPLVVLLFSRATNGLGPHWEHKLWEARSNGAGGHADGLDWPLTRPDT
ncbi:hypothetical protein H2248_003364 [Termitomyces sp. 'cryptogamus']|nr:hypothetical protein H2248_003364 [Termitomyces sp. 'cryptogamus']